MSNGVAIIPIHLGFQVLIPGPQKFVLTYESNGAIVPRANAPLWLSGHAELQMSGTWRQNILDWHEFAKFLFFFFLCVEERLVELNLGGQMFSQPLCY